jgi:hypothetical protein
VLLAYPFPPVDDLLAHQRDVRGAPSEANRPELQKETGQLGQTVSFSVHLWFTSISYARSQRRTDD